MKEFLYGIRSKFKIAKFAHDYRSRLLQEQGKTAAKMTKYDVALFMKKEGALTESEFNSWVKEKEGQEALQLTNQQKDAIKRGTIFSFAQGTQSYLDSDEVSNFTLGNVLGFERTTNEKNGATSIKSKAVSKQKFNAAEEMKKQSFYNYIKSLPTPQATYTELMRSIEFDKLDNEGKVEMMLKISGEKYNEAKERSKAGDVDGFLKEVGYAIHYLQDGGAPPHTEHGNYLQKLWRIPMHKAFEKGKHAGATARLSVLQENYIPEEIPFSSLEIE